MNDTASTPISPDDEDKDEDDERDWPRLQLYLTWE